MAAPVLSILVLMVPSRLHEQHVLEELTRQANAHPGIVEVLGLYDNKALTVGEKRNALLAMARGDYLAFVDDDDWVARDYVDAILDALSEGPDVLSFDVELTENGGRPKRCTYGLKFATYSGPDGYQGKPAHIHVWRSRIAKQVSFEAKNFAEDSGWAKRVAAQCQAEVRIDRVLYYYRFDQMRSETRCGHGAGQ